MKSKHATGAETKLNREYLMRKAARSVVTRSACLMLGRIKNVLIISGKHNSAFAEYLVTECYSKQVLPHLWMWNENPLPRDRGTVAINEPVKIPENTRSLLESSDLVIWLTQFENPKNARDELGPAVCSFWDEVYEIVKGTPHLSVNLFSEKSIEEIGIDYPNYIETFANAVSVDYRRIRRTGAVVRASLRGKKSINVKDLNGTNLRFSIENRPVGIEVGTLEDCFKKKEECEVEIPAGEVYVAPLEDSACGRLVADEARDFGVQELEMNFENGKMIDFSAKKGGARFREFLEKASGEKDRLAEFGVGINHKMKPTGLRVCDEKALGTVHLAIGNNTQLGGSSQASIHIDFNLYKPTVKADGKLIMEQGQLLVEIGRR